MSPRMRDAARRPLTFVFNGGPGAASVYLHLGLAGPRIVDFGPDGRDGAAAKLVDNPGLLARLHRPGDDRSDRHRLEPHRQARRRQSILGRAQRRQCDGQGDRALRRQEQPRRVAEISAGRELWRLPRRQGRRRAAAATRASSSPASSWCRRCSKASFQWGGSQYALGAALHFPSLVATELERTNKFTPEAMAEAERFALNEYLTTLAGRRRPATRPRRSTAASPR